MPATASRSSEPGTGRDHVGESRDPRPCRVTPSTTTASASTNAQKPGLASRDQPPHRALIVVATRPGAATSSATQPTTAAHAGADVQRGGRPRTAQRSPRARRARSVGRRRRRTVAPRRSVGLEVVAEEPTQRRPFRHAGDQPRQHHQCGEPAEGQPDDALNASRFVRFETGSSNDPLFARRAHAYRWGRGGTLSRVPCAARRA